MQDIIHNELRKRLDGNRFVLVLISILVITLLIDTVISNASGNLNINYSSNWGLSSFVIIAIIYSVGQYLLLKLIRYKVGDSGMIIPNANLIHKVVVVNQCILTALIGFVILQSFFFSYYYTNVLTYSTATSLSLSAVLFGLLSMRFFRWYRQVKSYLVILFGLAFITLAISEELAAVGMCGDLLTKGNIVRPNSDSAFPTLDDQPLLSMLADTYWVFAYLSFILIWVSIAFLMREHSKKIGLRKYLVIVSIPLGFFVTVILGVPGVTPIYKWFDPMISTIFFAINSTAGAILFAIAFKALSNTIPANNEGVRSYLIIAGYGLLLFFVSGQAVVVHAPYPPFGLASISLMGLSAYYVFVGIYSSALSFAQDSELRKQIRRSAYNEMSKFLDDIGKAQINTRIEYSVLEIAKRTQDQMVENSGIDSSLSYEEMKKYLDEVMTEIQSNAKSKRS